VIKRLSGIVIAIILALLTVQVVSAQGPNDRVVVNDRYVLHSGETHVGNLAIMAREVELQPGSRIDGDLSIISPGRVVLGGEITGNVSILSPGTELASTLHITGNLTICTRDFKQDLGATIGGSQSTGCNRLGEIFGGVSRGAGNLPPISSVILGDAAASPAARLFRIVVTSFAVAALAALAAMVFPRPMQRMTETVMTRFATTTAVGFVSVGVALVLTAVYLVSVVLTLGLMCIALPLFGVVWFVVIVGLLIGWIAVSVPLGRLLLHRFKIYPTPIVAAALGALVLTLAQGLLGMIPCIGLLSWLMLIVLGSAGFGAVLLTRFGARPYPEIILHRARPEIV
jgi:hypothetical protein